MQQLVYIQNRVNNAQIRRTVNDRGDEIIVVPSYTLPDDVVMNGLLYPADEIAKSYHTLEGTLAPIGHPYNDRGEYISANEAEAIDYFYAGVVNKNVQRVKDPRYGHRIYVEKHINVKVAERTELGRELLAAIEKGEPIHSSTGVLVNVDETTTPPTARGLVFDHDCVLLDEEGAATPDQGVGLLVNKHLLTQVTRNNQTLMVNTVAIKTNESMRDKEQKIQAAIQSLMPSKEWKWLADWGSDYAVIEADGENYRVEYTADADGNVTISGDPEPVRRVTTWEAITNAAKRLFNRGNTATTTNQEGENMSLKTLMKEKLGDAYNEDMSDEEILNAYEKSLKGNAAEQPTEPKGEQAEPKGELEVNADIQKLIDESVTKALKANQAAAEKATRDEIAEQLKANGVELTADEQAVMSVNSLQAIVAKTSPKRNSYGVAGGQPALNSDNFGDTSMPNVEV